MRSLFPSLLIVLVTICAAALGGPTQHDPADTFAFNSAPQIEHAALKSDNPLCKCQSCECLNCSCTPLEVGQPPDTLTVLTKSGGLLTEQRNLLTASSNLLTEPPPGLIVPVNSVAKKASPPAASGHWETRSAGFRGRRSFQVWVPDAAGGACAANGSCTSGACANGSLPGYTFNSGSCRSCR